MKARKVQLRFLIFAVALALCALFTGAQEEPQPQQPQQPDQPGQQQPEQTPPDNSQDNNPIYGPPKAAGYSFPGLYGPGEGELEADFSPLTGFQNSTLGYPVIRHSYWVPGLQFSSNVNSTPYGGASSGTDWSSYNYFMGNLSFLDAWSGGTFALNYSGGGFATAGTGTGTGFYQVLGLAQTFRMQRWLFQIIDSFSQSPESAFGFGGGTGLGVPGTGGSLGTTIPGLGGNYTTNQSIYGVGPYISNTGAVQATYALTRRSSITIAGSYGILHFTDPGNIDTNSTVASIGYNYALSRADTIGIVYRYSAFQYPGSPQAYGDHVANVAYGRKLTGRLALRLFAGPELTLYRIPVGTSSRTLGFSASAAVTYGFQHGAFSLGYSHGLYGGSGVLVGSVLDQATATFGRKLTRVWNGNINFGYAHNSPVGGTGASGYPAYNNWFFGGGVGRPIGRDFNFAVAYTATIGNYGGYACTGPGCNSTNTYNTITINLQWHPRPFVLD